MAQALSRESALDFLCRELGYSIAERWQQRKGRCFSNKKRPSKGGDLKCWNRRALPATTESLIMSLLDTLSALDVMTKPNECADALEKLVGAAVCYCHEFDILAWARKWRRQRPQASPHVPAPAQPSPPPSESAPVSPSIRPRPITLSSRASRKFASSPSEPSSAPSNGSPTPNASEPVTSPTEWIPVPGNSSPVEPRPAASSRYNLRSTISSASDPSSITPTTSIFTPHNHLSPFSTILRKPLSSSLDHRCGHIYIYTTPSNPYLKIGYTTQSPTSRLAQWRAQCCRPVNAIYTSSVPVPHVRRVEQLIHAELRDLRWKEVGCKGCGRDHVEWFECGEERVREVVERWERWIMGERYREGMDGVWRLREGEDGNVEEESEDDVRREEVERDEDVLARTQRLVAEIGVEYERRISGLEAEVRSLVERLDGVVRGRRNVVQEREGPRAARSATVLV